MSNFSHTSENIRMEHHHLHCRASRSNGEKVHAQLDLNCCVGNDNGHFKWGGKNFSETAKDIHFHNEHGQPILRAKLKQVNGDWVDRDLNLTERIRNDDGRLHFQQ